MDNGNIGQSTNGAKPNGPDLAALDLDDVGGTPLDWALAYAAAGLRVFPISANKKPLVKWGEGATTDPDIIRQWWATWPFADIGWALPADILVLDLDTGGSWRGLADFERLAGFVADLVETPQTSTPSGGRHLFFAVNGRAYKNWVKPIALNGADARAGIDTKTIGGLVILPSPGNGRSWLKPPSLPLAGVPAWVPTVEPYEPSEQNEARPYAGETSYGRAMLARALSDIPEAGNGFQAATLLKWCFTLGGLAAGGVLEFEPILQALVDAALRMPTYRANDPWKDLGKMVERVIRAGMERPISAPPEPKPPPQPSSPPVTLFNPFEAYVVPPFPLDVLTEGVQEFVVSHARIVGCDVSALAMTALVNFSAALDHRITLKMMRNGRWRARPRLWVLLCGEVSAGKTQAVNIAVEELEAVQSALWSNYDKAMEAYLKAKEEEDDTAVKPEKPPRYITMNITVEKVVDILSREQRAGILVKSDEVAGWIGSMEKYTSSSKGASSNRAFWLKAYDGGSYFEDRIGRGENHVRDLSVSILGATQPKKLPELHGLTSDGLLQRFIPLMMNPADLAKDEPAEGPFSYYAKLTRRLLDLKPQTIILDDDALAEMNRIRQRLRDLELVGSGIAEGFDGFVGKLHGIAGTLTLILHIINGPEVAAREVPVETVKNAGRIIFDCILKHALVFYRLAGSLTEGDPIQRLASYILTSSLTGKSRFVPSDFTSNVRHLRGLTLFELNKQISVFVAGGWLIPEPKRDEQHEKRPMIANPSVPHAWNLHPDVPIKMRDRAQAEQRRKAELASRWKAWGTDPDDPGPEKA
jgi:hypothetical protein